MKDNGTPKYSFTVHLAGNDYLTGIGLMQLFEDSGFIASAGLSASGLEAIEQTKMRRPDIVLVDALIEDNGVVETTTALVGLPHRPKVVVLSGSADSLAIEEAFWAGAYSYFLRGPMIEDIAAALRIVHRGGSVNTVVPDCIREVRQPALVDQETLCRLHSLDARDADIVKAVASGHSNSQISRLLHLSEPTVKARLTHLMQHLGAENRVQVAVAAVKAGLHGADVSLPG